MESPKLNALKVTLTIGQTKQLKLLGTALKVKWTSSNKNIAAVNSRGSLTAKNSGNCKIYAVAGGKKFTCNVTVLPRPESTIPAISLALSQPSLEITVGDRQQIIAVVSPANATNKTIVWTTSNAAVAAVDQNGYITGVAPGTCTITAGCGNARGICYVTVKSAVVPVYGIAVSPSYMELKIGDRQKVDAAIYPADATDKTITWTSSNNAIATVDSNGYVTGKTLGNVTITAQCGGMSDSCNVTIVRDFSNTDAVKNISYTSHRTKDGIAVILKNNYEYDVSLTLDCLFYNSNGVLLGKNSDYNLCFEAGKECALFASNLYDSDYNAVDYARYEVVLTANESYYASNASNITISSNAGSGNVMATVHNNGGAVGYAEIAIVFYKNNMPIGYDCKDAALNNASATDYLQFDYPRDFDWNVVVPDHFQVYVNCSY